MSSANFLPLVVRITYPVSHSEASGGVTDGSGCTDWKLETFEELTFKNFVDATCKASCNENATAFEYKDEDGDMITVRSDEEMISMLTSYYQSVGRNLDKGSREPLVIFPKISKSLAKRNKCGLKIDTKDVNVIEPMEVEGSRKKSGNIDEILACGKMRDVDLSYIELLGSGSCGSVYKAQHKITGGYLAVKVIPLDITKDVQQRIISELDILHRCNSNVIISFKGAYFTENKISICTEFMDGGSLDRYRCIPENILGPISVSVVQGLQYLWSMKILHRDVKPSNVLVNTQGQVKLCDFGISVQLIDSIAKTFIGTNAYMAPERILGQEYSIHSEVWSLGVSLFELAAGHFPYKTGKINSESIDLWKLIVDGEPPKLSGSNFSAQFVDFVSQCMQKIPSMRPAPESLMRHPFTLRFVESDPRVVARWVADGRRMQDST